MRFLYFGLPLGAVILRRAGFRLEVAAFGHRMPGVRRARHLAALEATVVLLKPDLADPAVRETLRAARPDAILSWFWPSKIPAEILALAPRGAFGVHPSLLPRHRGPDPYFHAIRAGDVETGVTLHRLEVEYDTGNLIAQRRLTIGPTEDAWRLARRLDRPSLELLVDCARRLEAGESLAGEPQDESRATEAPQPDEDELNIDWDLPAGEVLRLVRAAAPAPMASTLLGDSLVFVRRAVAYDGPIPGGLEPGEALRTPDGIVIVCGEGALRLAEVEQEDGTRVQGPEIDRLVPSK